MLFPKFFNCIEVFTLEYPNGTDKRPVAVGMVACVGKEPSQICVFILAAYRIDLLLPSQTEVL